MTGDCEQAAAIGLARHDERIKALAESIAHAERASAAAIKLASDELARRLEILNHAHQHAVEVQSSYVPRELHEAQVKEIEARVAKLEGDARELMGRLWLPFAGLLTIASAIGAVAVRLFFR